MWVIIGANSGLGSCLYKLLGKHERIGTTRLKPDGSEPRDATGIVCIDPCREENVCWLRESVKDKHPSCPINLVHCVGLSIDKMTHKMDLDDWEYVFRVNLTSAFLCAKHFLPLMRERGYGRIIFCGSVVPNLGVAGCPAYSASKSGLIGLAKSIASENAGKDITANVLELGYFDEGMGKKLPQTFKDQQSKKIPAGRFGNGGEFVSAVRFCVENGYVNGALIPVTGGL